MIYSTHSGIILKTCILLKIILVVATAIQSSLCMRFQNKCQSIISHYIAGHCLQQGFGLNDLVRSLPTPVILSSVIDEHVTSDLQLRESLAIVHKLLVENEVEVQKILKQAWRIY